MLDQLAALPEVPADRLAPPPTPKYLEEAFSEYRYFLLTCNPLDAPSPANTLRPLATDYLASSGAALKAALAADAESTRKLADALKLFDDCERQTKEFILAFKV